MLVPPSGFVQLTAGTKVQDFELLATDLRPVFWTVSAVLILGYCRVGLCHGASPPAQGALDQIPWSGVAARTRAVQL